MPSSCSEESSGDRGRLGHVSKQRNSLLNYLLVEAAHLTNALSVPRRKVFCIAGRRSSPLLPGRSTYWALVASEDCIDDHNARPRQGLLSIASDSARSQ